MVMVSMSMTTRSSQYVKTWHPLMARRRRRRASGETRGNSAHTHDNDLSGALNIHRNRRLAGVAAAGTTQDVTMQVEGCRQGQCATMATGSQVLHGVGPLER
jgi:hypothetical protein